MSQTLIAVDHARVRALMSAMEDAGHEGAGRASLQEEIDFRTHNALVAAAANASDALLQLDLAVPLLEAARDEAEGTVRDAIEAGLVALASAALALSCAAGVPVPAADSLADLAAFATRAPRAFLQENRHSMRSFGPLI
jgi:hypothetical protein